MLKSGLELVYCTHLLPADFSVEESIIPVSFPVKSSRTNMLKESSVQGVGKTAAAAGTAKRQRHSSGHYKANKLFHIRLSFFILLIIF